jgi:hypothetical protein
VGKVRVWAGKVRVWIIAFVPNVVREYLMNVVYPVKNMYVPNAGLRCLKREVIIISYY